MFQETIKDIDHEIEWIDYELTRQSTNSDQEKCLKAKRTALKLIKVLCSDYEDGKHLSHVEFGNVGVQVLSAEQSTHKDVPDNQLSVFQVKLSQRLSLTNIRTFQVDRQGDNMLYCKELGQRIPSTPQGKIDTEQLAREISSQKDFFQSR